MEYIEILKILALSQVITTFAPIGWIIELLPDNLVKYILIVLTSCWKCCALWLGLAMFGLWPAITASIMASIFIDVKQNITSLLWQRKKQ
jgi:hypothetical protein